MRTLKSNIFGPVLFVALAWSFAACNTTNFKSNTPKAPAPATKTEEKTLKLTCDPAQDNSSLVTDVVSTSKTSVKLEGEFCHLDKQSLAGELMVLFLLDFSGSMMENDPDLAGSCGRLKAAQAISTKMDEFVAKGINVKFAIQAFGDAALPVIGPVDAAGFKSQLLADTFCRDNAGATNYEAAFNASSNLLQTQNGVKLVYFISDGTPTVSGLASNLAVPLPIGPLDSAFARAYSAGLSAAERLRQLDKLTLNAIYIENKFTTAVLNPAGSQDPEQYLEKITGSKDNVRLVSNADKLDESILSFETPEVTTLEQSSVSGKLSAGSQGAKNVEIASLTADPSRPGVWLFVTKPFPLYGEAGQVVENRVVFSVKDSNGKEQTATAVIKYKFQDQ
jgi:hypothetical protein